MMMVLDRSEIVLDDSMLMDNTDISRISKICNDEIVEILLDDWIHHSLKDWEIILNANNSKLCEFQKHIDDFITNILLVSISDNFSIGDMWNYLAEKNQIMNYLEFLYENIEIILSKANYFTHNNINYSKSSLNVFFALIRLQFINRWRFDLIEEISDKILEIDTDLDSSDFQNYSKYMLTGSEDFLED